MASLLFSWLFLFLPCALYIYMWNGMLTPTFLASKSSGYALLFMCISRVPNSFLHGIYFAAACL